MKKNILTAIVCLLAVVMLVSLAACGKEAAPAEPTVDPGKPAEVVTSTDVTSTDVTSTDAPLTAVTITAADGFEAAGVSSIVCEKTGTYSFTASGNTEVTWSVIVLDSEFEDGVRYLTQAHEPALEGDGTLEIKEGQYIYVICSNNAFTADEADADAALTVDFAA